MRAVRGLVVVAALGAAPAACTAVFSLDGLTGGDAGPDGSTVEGGASDAPADSDAGGSGDDGPATGDAPSTADVASETSTVDGPETSTQESGPGEAGSPTYEQEVLMDSPVGYWRLGEPVGTTTAKDSSGHGVSGTYEGGVTLAVKGAIANDPDTAASFDGTSGYVDMGQVFQFAGNAVCSFEAWVMPTVTNSYQGVLSRSDQNGPPSEGYLLFVEPTPDPLYAFQRVEDSNKQGIESTGEAATGVWAHVVLTYDGTTATLYMNGQQQATATMSTSISGAASDFVLAVEAGGVTEFLTGALDEVAVYDTVLPADRVLAHYNVGMGLPPGTPAGDP